MLLKGFNAEILQASPLIVIIDTTIPMSLASKAT